MIHHTFELADDLPADCWIDIQEDRGEVRYRINRNLNGTQMIAALNEGAEAVLSGGHWFQEWKGDIISRRNTGTPGHKPTSHLRSAQGTGEYDAA